MTKVLLVLTVSNLLFIQCGSRQAPPGSDTSRNNRPTGNKKCDFSELKPLKARANYGFPLVSMTQPTYPPEAKERGIKGRVEVLVLVNVHKGSVENACVMNGDEMLRSAAKDAAMKAKFQPYTKYIRERYSYAEERITYSFGPP